MLVFLKLGGSLITEKDNPHTPRLATLTRLSDEIARAKLQNHDLQMVIGHGSGSFGHVPASQYRTRLGVHTPKEWRGFVEVWREARALNQIVIESLLGAGLPVIAFPPSASTVAQDGKMLSWDIRPLQIALHKELIPVIAGDVILDTVRGGTILSTEELFVYLAQQLLPERILIAGTEAGVWADFPHRTQLLQQITPANYQKVAPNLQGSNALDVTGGMAQKVLSMLELVHKLPDLKVSIFTGAEPSLVYTALKGEFPGTLISL